MQAPAPNPVVLQVHRTRCSCHTETLVFSPRSWYHGQRSVEIEPGCVGCGRSLLEQDIPEGAKWEAYAVAEVPTSLAQSVSQELADEVRSSRDREVPEPAPVPPVERWTVAHEAPEDYATWLAAQPARMGPVSRAEVAEWVGAAALVAVYVAFCVVV